MKIKTYTGKRMRIIMSQIRKELGPDAIIISANEDPSGVVVTAAIEENNETNMHSSDILQVLKAHGVLQSVQSKFINSQFLQFGFDAVLENVISFDGSDIAQNSKIVLVGPPGVGKSLATAKLAAAGAIAGKKVHLITADRRKSGAIEQMMKYAQNVEATISVIENPLLLRNRLATIDSNVLVIIDTPGANPFSPKDMQHTTSLIMACGVAPTLVLPAGMDGDELMDIATVFEATGARNVILTKCDIARRLGSVINMLVNRKLNFSAYGIGPSVADLLVSANSEDFSKLILQKTEVLIDSNISQRAAS